MVITYRSGIELSQRVFQNVHAYSRVAVTLSARLEELAQLNKEFGKRLSLIKAPTMTADPDEDLSKVCCICLYNPL